MSDTMDAMKYAATAARPFVGVDLAKGEPTYTCVKIAPGNAAPMREALIDIVLLTLKAGMSLASDVACGIIASKAKRALSAPARNCDRFRTAEDAVCAWLDTHPGSERPNWRGLAAWLFAKAEGEAAERELSKNWPDNGPEIGQFASKPDWSVRDALALANMLANHGLRDGNADAASSCIYSLCRHIRHVGNAAAMREDGVDAQIDALKRLARTRVDGHECAMPCSEFADIVERLDAARKRELASRDQTSFHCGDCAKFGFDCGAGDVDGNEDCIACEKFRRRALPGNAAAMREALEEQLRYWNAHIHDRSEEEMRKRTEAALSAPARNCDVGTAEEQAIRKADYCNRYSPLPTDGCDECPLRGYNRASPELMVGYSCDLAWAQLPYKAEGGAEC